MCAIKAEKSNKNDKLENEARIMKNIYDKI